MPDEVKKVEYYSATIADKVGEGARVLGALCGGGANFTAIWGYPVKGKWSQIDLVPTDASAFKKAAKKAGIKLGEKRAGLLVQGDDRPGAVAEALGKLAAAGINVRVAQALTSGSGRYSVIIGVDSALVAKGFKTLTATAPAKAAAAPVKPAPVKKTVPAKKKAKAKK